MERMLWLGVGVVIGFAAAYVAEIVDVVRNLFQPKGGN